MRTIVGLLLLSPTLVLAQDTAVARSTAGDDVKEWQRQQVLAAQQDDQRRAEERRRYEHKLKEIESNQSAAWDMIRSYTSRAYRAPVAWRLATSNVVVMEARHIAWRLATPDIIGQDGRDRRARLRDDDVSGNHLNTARRADDPRQLMSALEARRAEVDRLLANADALSAEAKVTLRNAKDLEEFFGAEDHPQAPPDYRELVRTWQKYFRRQATISRAIADLESMRSASLRAEGALLDSQIGAGKKVIPAPGSD